MVFLLGTKDYVDELGYVVERCPDCHTTGPFTVYQTKRKLTLYLVPTLSVSEQQLLVCGTCGAKFSVPEEMRDDLTRRLMTQAEVSARIRDGRETGNGRSVLGQRARTYYQILQVDPDADPEVIEAAFKRLALKYHPDRSTSPDAPARMRELVEAKEHLMSKRKRRAYDASIGIERPPELPEALRPEDV